MNSHFLSLLQWLIALTCSTWEPFHPWKTLHHLPQGSSIPGKTVLSWTPVTMKASQHSGRLYWIKPRTNTFWVHYSDTWCCLTPTGHVSTYRRRSTMDNQALQHLENQYCHEQQSVFLPFLLIKTSSAHFHCTLCYYWCILRFDVGLDGFSVTGFSMAGYYNLEAEKDCVGKMHQIWTKN